MLTFGSLFAGIGGFDLGFERAGMQCKWQVEIDPFCQRVLAKHWPDVRRWDDVRTWPQPDRKRVDVICGGFPCQDISNAGHKAGINGERSGLWKEYLRIICGLRPRIVVVENVAALLARGMDVVLGDLAAGGFDAEWDTIPACVFGAPHSRERVFIVAYPQEGGFQGCLSSESIDGEPPCEWNGEPTRVLSRAWNRWSNASENSRMDHGIPDRIHRVGSCGNAVVPQVAEWIGHRIVAHASKIN